MQLLNLSFVCIPCMLMRVGSIFWARVLSACVCPCAPICFDVDWIDCVFGVRGKKRERENNRRKKNREGDLGLGNFQALCEQRKRGGGRGKVRPLLNELGQLAETIQSVGLAGAALYRSDPQSCVPQLVSGSTA